MQQPNPGVGKKLGFNRVYWIANWMELVERFAYYGVRTVLPVFMVLSLAEGGPEFTHTQKGSIYAIWALVQSFVPVFSGVFADRYGYKINIAISTVLKILGYLLMGYCITIAESLAGMPIAEARAQGTDLTYWIFFSGAQLLALGTAIFKPGVQGLLANEMPPDKAALGWAIFYQCVNIGGFVGPFIAGYLRILEWEYVFLLCSAAIALNFIPLFMFAEPKREHKDEGSIPDLIGRAVKGLLEPRLFFFTITFAGFWLMFYQLFDILPNFIDDWIDSRAAAEMLAGMFGEGAIPTTNGGNLTQEWIINFNPLLISLFAWVFGYMTGKMHSLTAIIIGIAIAAVGIYGLGTSMSGWVIFLAIAGFSVGEMIASPTKMRYVSSIAPPGKQGQYMGYVNMTVGIGWSIGSIVAGNLYEHGGDKVNLAKKYLIEKANLAADMVNGLPKDKVMPLFEETAKVDAWGARQLLWDTYEPYSMWMIFMAIGIGSMIMLIGYNAVVRAAEKNPQHSFNTNGLLWVQGALVPILGIFAFYSFTQPVSQDMLAVYVWTVLFALMLGTSFMVKPKKQTPGAA
ncbi:MAG: MFS transporter [Bradymonadia bacterium]